MCLKTLSSELVGEKKDNIIEAKLVLSKKFDGTQFCDDFGEKLSDEELLQRFLNLKTLTPQIRKGCKGDKRIHIIAFYVNKDVSSILGKTPDSEVFAILEIHSVVRAFEGMFLEGWTPDGDAN